MARFPVPTRFRAPKPPPPPPPLPPRDGRIRCGIITPGLGAGGAERWIVAMLAHVRAGVQWAGVGVLHPQLLDEEICTPIRQVCPILCGAAEIRRLAQDCDVLVGWGMPTRHLVEGAGCRVVLMSHGCGEWTRTALADSAYADALVACSRVSVAPFPPAEQARVRVIFNCANTDRLGPGIPRAEARRLWGVPPEAPLVGYLGRFSHEKGYPRLPEALEYLPADWHGVACGWGAGEPELRASRAFAEGRLHLPGRWEHAGSFLRAVDVLLLPSLEEGCSLTMCEALWVGTPIVATPCGLLLERPDLARLVPTRQAGPFYASALEADRCDPAGTALRVRRGRRYARRELQASVFAARWEALLRETAGGLCRTA